MSNLPPHVNTNDPDAPWNQRFREPDSWCPHCGTDYVYSTEYRREVRLDELRIVLHEYCPQCGNVVFARLIDETEPYLEAWRRTPDIMVESIDSYNELRDIPQR